MFKFFGNFFPDFITTSANRWSNCRNNILWLTTIFSLYICNKLRTNFCYRSTPAGMCQPCNMMFRIIKKKWNTISVRSIHRDSCFICHKGINSRHSFSHNAIPLILCCNFTYLCLMNLRRQHQIFCVKSYRGSDSSKILLYLFRVITAGKR